MSEARTPLDLLSVSLEETERHLSLACNALERAWLACRDDETGTLKEVQGLSGRTMVSVATLLTDVRVLRRAYRNGGAR
jgi:hypothetical protein